MKMENEMEMMKARNEELKKENDGLLEYKERMELSSRRNENEKMNLLIRVRGMEEANENFLKLSAEKRKEASEKRMMEKEKNKLQNQATVLHQQLNEMRDMVEWKEEEKRVLEERLERMKNMLVQCMKKVMDTENAMAELRNRLNESNLIKEDALNKLSKILTVMDQRLEIWLEGEELKVSISEGNVMIQTMSANVKELNSTETVLTADLGIPRNVIWLDIVPLPQIQVTSMDKKQSNGEGSENRFDDSISDWESGVRCIENGSYKGGLNLTRNQRLRLTLFASVVASGGRSFSK